MDFRRKARIIEQKIASSLEAAVDEFVGSSFKDPLEIVHAVVDRAEQQVQEIGRGRRVFPFNRVTVHVVAGRTDKAARARIASVFDGPPTLTERLKTRLESAGCRCDDLVATVAFVAKGRDEWQGRGFGVEFDRIETTPVAAASVPSEPPRLRLAVLAGETLQKGYAFQGGRIDIGRRSDVRDARERLVRTNHVAFAEDGPDVNRTVSRRHAHIAYIDGTGEYRIWDDRSQHGTNILRRGQTLPVPAGARGVRLQSGDEIQLGQARLRVVFEAGRKA